MNPERIRLLLALSLVLAACQAPPFTPSATPSPKATQLALPTATATVPVTPAPTATPLPTLTPPPSATPTPWPTPDAAADSRAARLPILMYHYVEPWPEGADDIRKNLTVRPEDFAAQMQYLQDNGYAVVNLYDLIYTLTLGRPLPEKAVALTFDDGYRTLADYMLPVMEAYGYRATLFVVSEFMDLGYAEYLTWPQVEELAARGWSIEPHSRAHLELAGRDRDFQLYHMLGSIEALTAHLGRPPRFFCYPAGKYDEQTLQLAREMNLWGGVTTAPGRVHTLADQYTLPRLRIGGQDTLQDFINAVSGD